MSCPATDRYERRKRQNRQAQRTHRDKKVKQLAKLTCEVAEAEVRADDAIRQKNELEIIIADLAKAIERRDMPKSIEILEESRSKEQSRLRRFHSQPILNIL